MKKDRYLNKYKLIYKPDHPNSMNSENWKGYIYEHIYIMSEYLGRSIENDEEVHHLDFDETNNNIRNLLLLSSVSHKKLHKWIDDGCRTIKNTEFSVCEHCNERLYLKQYKFCSNKCRNEVKKSKMEQYPIEDIIEVFKTKKSILQTAIYYNMSDNGLKSYIAKKLGIENKNVLTYLKNL